MQSICVEELKVGGETLMSRSRFAERSVSFVVLTAFTLASGGIVGAADNTGFANEVVKAGQKSKMSRAPINVGGVNWTGPTSSPPPIKGASVAVMPCPLAYAVCKYLFDSAKAAATAMGWEAFPIDNKGDPAVAQKGVEAAINRNVNCVLTLAHPARDIKAQITRGKEKGIAFVTGFSDDPRQFGGDVGYGLDYAAAGALLGAHVIANGGGGIVIFNAPQDPQFNARIDGFKDFVTKYGGDTKVVHVEDFSLAQGAPGEITKMQALLTRFPANSFKWVIAPFDETLTPLLQTAQQRGRSEIRGVSFDGEEVAYADIRKGGPQTATINWGLEWVAWAGIDECNRALNKAETGVNKDFPIQLSDKTNVPAPNQKYDIGFDFKSHYTQMWNAARKP
jgi:ABC-type sugar transport system substrate-binding protein